MNISTDWSETAPQKFDNSIANDYLNSKYQDLPETVNPSNLEKHPRQEEFEKSVAKEFGC